MQNSNLTVQFIRNFTVEPVGEALGRRAAESGLTLEASYGAYDNIIPEILSLTALEMPPSYLVLALDLEFLFGGLYSPQWTFGKAEVGLQEILQALEAVPPQTFVLITTFLPPFGSSLPWLPGLHFSGRNSAAFSLNAILRNYAAVHPDRCGLLDFERIAARLGEATTLDKRFGLMMKAPFREEFAKASADEIMRFVRCRSVAAKKVIILDCDNTLWGGVVGECGIDGIQLDSYEYPGIAYYRFQYDVLTLMEQGVLVCICSKNDEASVWEVLDQHPHCLIKRNHLTAWRINWEDKASNIKSLAQELNLSVDSMVFVDDNPVECELIQASFPGIAVLQVPSKIYNFPGLIHAKGWFDRVSINQEDKDRARYYQAEKGRREIQKQHVDSESFLRDLKMRAVVRLLEPADIPRVSQLSLRTNQFNLTTTRYDEAALENLRQDPAARVYILQAADRFGPVGLSGLIIYRRYGHCAEVDTFLLSCRIIGRKFDHALFCESLRLLLADWEVTKIKARYIPTPKNNVVSNLWAEYGFPQPDEPEPGVYTATIDGLKILHPSTIQITDKL